MSAAGTTARAVLAETMIDAGKRRPLTLTEWQPQAVDLTWDQASALAEARGRAGRNWLKVEPGRRSGQWVITPNSFVGAFTARGLRIIVRPKIDPKNLFVLLEVGLPPEAWQAEQVDLAENDELLPALVSFFARAAETTLARGLFHHYRHEEDDLLALRGRIDFVRQFRRGGVLVPMACSWDDFTADVDENRCLTAAIRLALRVPDVPHDDRRRLRRLLAALDGVAEPTASVALDRLDRLQYTRLNEHYRPALRLARLILANCTLQDQHGDTAASAFMLDMNQLFEDFVTARLRRALRGQLDTRAQARTYLDDERLVPIQPDLVFERQGRRMGVADLKYKLTDSDRGTSGAAEPLARQGDYYQLLAYTTALDLPEGTLIYCADVNEDEAVEQRFPDGSLAKSTITVRHAGTQLHTIAIDLSGSSSDIDAQITALAGHLVETSGTSVS